MSTFVSPDDPSVASVDVLFVFEREADAELPSEVEVSVLLSFVLIDLLFADNFTQESFESHSDDEICLHSFAS